MSILHFCLDEFSDFTVLQQFFWRFVYKYSILSGRQQLNWKNSTVLRLSKQNKIGRVILLEIAQIGKSTHFL